MGVHQRIVILIEHVIEDGWGGVWWGFYGETTVQGGGKEMAVATVISATTRFGGRGEAKRAEFLGKAHVLLTQAQVTLHAGDAASALELAYQAALRTAGARIAVSAVAQRKRKPHGAWDQLALVDETGVEQAADFKAFSRLRSRVSSGMEVGVDSAVVSEFIERVQGFLDFVDMEAGWVSDVA